MADESLNHVRRCFTVAYKFWERHRGATTKDQFDAMYDEAAKLYKADPFTADLIMAACSEIARDYRVRENIAS